MPIEPGSLLHNRYRILSVIGKGGMGAVYRAADETLGVTVAVKENLNVSPESERQFRREATLLASLRHPNLPRVTDHFTIPTSGQYLVMDFVEGEDLRQRLERTGSVSESEALAWARPLCDALRYLHTRTPPVVHRDIKPGNIKITPEGVVMLVDFGLAKVMESTQSTTLGAKALTPGFSPPEQYGWARTDPRTDIYALAATFYCLLTGVVPEDGLERAMGNLELTPLQERNGSVSSAVAAAIEQGMAIRADDRHQSIDKFASALFGGAVAAAVPEEVTVSAKTRVARPQQALGPKTVPATGLSKEKPKSSGRWLWWVLPFLALGGGVFALPLLGVNPLTTVGLLPASSMPSPTSTLEPSPLPPATSTSTPTEVASPTASPTATPTETLLPTDPPPPSVTPSPAATAQGGGAQIAFVSERSGKPQIHLVDLDGEAERQLTDHAEGACQPAWSPDGTRLLFVSPCRGNELVYPNAAIYMLDLASGGVTRLTNSPRGDFDPEWSPDGSLIAFTSLRDGREHVYLMNADGSDQRTLSRRVARDSQPSWAPDGGHLAFMSSRAGRPEVWIMSASGEPQNSHTRDLAASDDLRPRWSPDGLSIAFEKRAGGVPSIWASVVEDAGFNTVLLSGTVPSASPRWSPDGKWLVFEAWPDGRNHDVWVMAAHGGDAHRLTHDLAADYQPAWRPGG